MFQLLVWHNKANIGKPIKNITSHVKNKKSFYKCDILI